MWHIQCVNSNFSKTQISQIGVWPILGLGEVMRQTPIACSLKLFSSVSTINFKQGNGHKDYLSLQFAPNLQATILQPPTYSASFQHPNNVSFYKKLFGELFDFNFNFTSSLQNRSEYWPLANLSTSFQEIQRSYSAKLRAIEKSTRRCIN